MLERSQLMTWLDLRSKYRCKQLCQQNSHLHSGPPCSFSSSRELLMSSTTAMHASASSYFSNGRSKQCSQLVHWQTPVQTTLDHLQEHPWEVHPVLDQRLTDCRRLSGTAALKANASVMTTQQGRVWWGPSHRQ